MTRRTNESPPAPPPGGRRGITLLEVLVACGILVVGLASLASIMPAAGSRLAQAAVEDRAGTAAANAFAEVVNRGLASSDLFTATDKACYFGAGLDTSGPLFQGNSPVKGVIAGPAAALLQRIDLKRGFFLEDDLVYLPFGASDTPANLFLNNNAGPREYREGVCWGALLAPTSYPAAAGSEAVLSIPVFKKPGDSMLVKLLGSSGSPMFEHSTAKNNGSSSGTGAEDEQARKQFLAGCSYVLALPSVTGVPPKWLRITSSWTNPGPGAIEDATQRQSYVVLDLDAIPLADRGKYLTDNGTNILVIAFENLMRVDQYTLSLD